MEFEKENCLARVSFTGGIIGLVAGSQFARLEKVVATHNADGWNVAEIVPESRNLIVWVFRIVLLILTLGLWTLATGYILIFERPKNGDRSRLETKDNWPQQRKEPRLSAIRTGQ
jgi:hypothetical protein